MRREDGLCSLHMRVTGQDQFTISFGCGKQCKLDNVQPIKHLGLGVTHPELQVGDNLIVPTSSRVQFAAEITQALNQRLLDVGMDILKSGRKRELARFNLFSNLVECGSDLFRLGSREQADFGKHAGMSLAGANIVAVKPAIVRDGFGERLDALVCFAFESSAPGLAHGSTSSSAVVFISLPTPRRCNSFALF